RLGGEPLVRAFELGPFLDTRVSRLSSGMRGRAGLVAGMLFDPHVIMLDEPTNSIDPITRDLLIDYVNRLHACGRTILTVTHDLEYCWKTMDRAVILDDRRIAGDVMLADIPDHGTFTHIATLGHGRRTVDFGLERQMARSEE
ncbi:ATP-binding cassette domain-containing protein, partial [Bifidobacterium dentium]